MTARKKANKVRRVVLGVGQPMYSPIAKTLELARADFINPAKILKLKIQGLGPWNRIRLVAEVLK